MRSPGLRHISVWVDEAAPEQGPFVHALEWAAHLGLPLHGIAAPPTGSGVRSAEQMETCARACLGRGIPWVAFPGQGPLTLEAEQSTRPPELCVFGHALPARLKEELLRRSLRGTGTSVLVCPRPWRPVSRVLVVQQHGPGGSRFLDSAAGVCRAFQVEAVVLTVARSEREARLRQRSAEEAFAAQRCPAEFDFMVGWDVRTAVAWAARWRRCSHVVLEKENALSWWRWLRGDTMGRLLELSDSLTFLALPGAGSSLLAPAEASPGREAGLRPIPSIDLFP